MFIQAPAAFSFKWPLCKPLLTRAISPSVRKSLLGKVLNLIPSRRTKSNELLSWFTIILWYEDVSMTSLILGLASFEIGPRFLSVMPHLLWHDDWLIMGVPNGPLRGRPDLHTFISNDQFSASQGHYKTKSTRKQRQSNFTSSRSILPFWLTRDHYTYT